MTRGELRARLDDLYARAAGLAPESTEYQATKRMILRVEAALWTPPDWKPILSSGDRITIPSGEAYL